MEQCCSTIQPPQTSQTLFLFTEILNLSQFLQHLMLNKFHPPFLPQKGHSRSLHTVNMLLIIYLPSIFGKDEQQMSMSFLPYLDCFYGSSEVFLHLFVSCHFNAYFYTWNYIRLIKLRENLTKMLT